MCGTHVDPAIPYHIHGFFREDGHSPCDSQDEERRRLSSLTQRLANLDPLSRVDRGPLLAAHRRAVNGSALCQEGARGCCG